MHLLGGREGGALSGSDSSWVWFRFCGVLITFNASVASKTPAVPAALWLLCGWRGAWRGRGCPLWAQCALSFQHTPHPELLPQGSAGVRVSFLCPSGNSLLASLQNSVLGWAPTAPPGTGGFASAGPPQLCTRAGPGAQVSALASPAADLWGLSLGARLTV